MLTGTPLDLTPFGVVLRGIGLMYWLLAAGALFAAIRLPSKRRSKSLWSVLAVAVFGYPVVSSAWHEYQARSRLKAATAHFEMRCKSAGERIYRTVENVDGILLLNVRPQRTAADLKNPNWADAALPHEYSGDWYIRTFLFWEHKEDKRSARGYINEHRTDLPGYHFVDVLERDGTIWRYKLAKTGDIALSREPLKDKPARYAVSYANYLGQEDRRQWTAGTKVSIVDTETQETLAEKTWFSIETGQGNTTDFRAPWAFAKTCPPLEGTLGSSTRFFVDKVLIPQKGE